ncbi:GerW family sporulation protein [Pontibacter pamirensis]|uniref:GerW family sporulation protein n=1 Tax=Pontibacter pamirensis TaxID=2562824 RepID=UPI00138963CA|nr:spore germination protein GerW family protein [Pontibacter pamirensis]
MENQDTQSSASSSFVERIAEKLGGAANAARIYGEPVERNGFTVIPVSKAVYGFGGGAGMKTGEEGSGGGGGMVLTPVGYIEISEGSTRFRSIKDPQTIIKIFAISGVLVMLTARSITKIFRK